MGKVLHGKSVRHRLSIVILLIAIVLLIGTLLWRNVSYILQVPTVTYVIDSSRASSSRFEFFIPAEGDGVAVIVPPTPFIHDADEQEENISKL